MKLKPRHKYLIKKRVEEYNEAKNKEKFKRQIEEWKEFRIKYLKDHYSEDSLKTDEILYCIKSILEEIC